MIKLPPQEQRTFQHLLQARPHHVNVFDAEEAELGVLVESLILVALARRPIRHRVDPGPRVHHVHVARVRIRPPHRLQHLLVLQAARTESGQRLAAPANRGPIRVQVCQHGQPALRPKLGAAHQHGLADARRHVEQLRVRVA